MCQFFAASTRYVSVHLQHTSVSHQVNEIAKEIKAQIDFNVHHLANLIAKQIRPYSITRSLTLSELIIAIYTQRDFVFKYTVAINEAKQL